MHLLDIPFLVFKVLKILRNEIFLAYKFGNIKINN